MTMKNDDQVISQHYGRGELGTTILAALQAAGKNPARLTIKAQEWEKRLYCTSATSSIQPFLPFLCPIDCRQR